jgi:hypothetical protein
MATLAELEAELAAVAAEFFRLVDEANALERAGDRGPEFQRLSARIRELRAERVRINKEKAALAAPPGSVNSAGEIQSNAETARDDGAASQLPAVGQQVIDQEGRIAPAVVTPAPTNADGVDTATDVNTNPTNSAAVRTTTETQATPAATAAPGAANSAVIPGTAGDAVVPPQNPGAGAPSDDSLDRRTSNSTAAAVNARFSTALQPQPNILDQYASYTYSISIYLLGSEEIADFQASKSRSVNPRNLLIQSGGDRKSTRLNSVTLS